MLFRLASGISTAALGWSLIVAAPAHAQTQSASGNAQAAPAADAAAMPPAADQTSPGDLSAQGAATPAAVQGAEAPTGGADIVVTGSRITRSDYTSASPIVTTGEAVLKATGAVNIEQSLNQLPQFVPGSGSQGGGASAAASAGRATLNLRGLGDKRTLVLLDGRRLPPSTVFNVTDVNIIPLSIVESVETITGGASAVYGSDAIAGVVNFRTRRHINGVEIDGQMGDTFRGDRMAADLSAVAGWTSKDDRFNVIAEAGYTKRDELKGSERSFFDLGILSSFIGQGTFVPSATNLPSQAAVDANFANLAPGTVSRTNSLGFNNNGSLFSQVGAYNYAGPTSGNYVTYGNVVRQPVARQQSIERPLERYNFFGKAEYEVSPALTLYAQALYNRTDAQTNVGSSLTQFITVNVSANNPFIPASLRSILASRPNPAANFSINRRFVELPPRVLDAQFDTSQFIVGARGKIGVGDWTYDIYGSRDRTVINNYISPGVLGSRVNQLLQAADGGQSLCAGGYNPFGLANANGISAQCAAYITRRISQYEDIRQNTIEGSVQGTLFTLPAGDVKASVVGTYRENKYNFVPDAALIAGDVFATNATNPTRGATNVKEVAAELFVPILKDKPFFHTLNVSLGGRYSHYNITGDIWTYKAEGEWSPVRMLMVRGGYQRAVRAPNIGELFSSPTGAQVQIGNPPTSGDPCDVRSVSRTGSNAGQLRTLCIATGVPASLVDTYNFTTVAIPVTNTGNLALTPEKASTKTLGVVLKPDFASPVLRSLSISVDYYNISIRDVISTVAGNTALAKCYNQDGSNPTYSVTNTFCQLITRDNTGGIVNVSLPYLNLGGLKTSGVDFQLDWSVPLGTLGNLGDTRLTLNSVVSYLGSYQIKNFATDPFQEFRGTIDATNALPLPRWRYTTTGNLTLGDFDFGLRWRHLNAMRDVTSVIRPASPAPGVPAYDVFDLTARIRVNDQYQFRMGVTNLFDTSPLVIAGTPGNTLPGTYDVLGRSFYVGFKARF
ncbi:TonB-dependent receptor domain-containing protein [Sphingomonas sp. CLY1604]|uniref:TonB-dependent receptor domain-containing protein n=1 Tax=Sphingomonas sp. CLY1604 TaxID=3457786 RepID=UPI003FD7EF09